MDNQRKQTEEVLAEIYRNAELALQSINDIMPQVDDHETREELSRQHEEYEKFSSRACAIAKDLGIDLKEPNPFKKMMMWGSIKMNTLTDNSRSHIAEMMIQGTVMGISALRSSAGADVLSRLPNVLPNAMAASALSNNELRHRVPDIIRKTVREYPGRPGLFVRHA